MESPVFNESDNEVVEEVAIEEEPATAPIAAPLSAAPAKPLEAPKLGPEEIRLATLAKFMKNRAARIKGPSTTKKEGVVIKSRLTSQYGYDEKGVFTEFDKNGAVVKKIPIPTYRLPTKEEVAQLEETRYNAIGAAEALYEEKV
jgi:hypothetical protein